MRYISRLIRFPVIAAATAFLALAALTGCGGSTSSSGSTGTGGHKQLKLAFFGFSAENAYTQAILKGAQREAAKLGATIRFFDGRFDPAVQAGQIQDAAASGNYNGLIVLPNDPPSAAPVVREAISQGAKVAALQFNVGKQLNTQLQVPGLTTRVIYGYDTGATAIAQRTVQLCQGKSPCNVVVMWGAKTQLFEAARRNGLMAVLRQHPNVKVIAEPDAGYLRDPAYKAMQDVLQRHVKIDVVLTASGDQMIAGAAQALREAGVTVGAGPDAVKLIGNSASQTAVAGIRSGAWDGTYLELPVTMGRLGVEQLVSALRGQPYKAYVNMDRVSIECAGTAYVNQATLAKCPAFSGEWDG